MMMKRLRRSLRYTSILVLLLAFLPGQQVFAANVVQNAGFESGTSGWKFHTNGAGSFTVAGPGYGSAKAAVVSITKVGSNIQLFQSDVPLQPNTAYRLTFWALSNTGSDLRVSVQKHGSPYTIYGLKKRMANLGTGWQLFTFDFTTAGFSAPVTDARLMFWFASDAVPGDQYRIDDVSLTTVGSPKPVAPTIVSGPSNQSVVSGQTATFAVTANGTAPLAYQWQKNGVNIVGATGASYTSPKTTLADDGALFRCRVTNSVGSVTSGSAKLTVTSGGGGGGGSKELLVYDYKYHSKNDVITKCNRGFPKQDPTAKPNQCIKEMVPGSNGNWISPVDYAGGTLYMRAHVYKQPVAQNMRLQFCVWQNNFSLETCTKTAAVSGKPGTQVTWSEPIPTMWKKDGKPMKWAEPRQRYGNPIKNSAGLPVSDYNGWNWSGEDPNKWYPLDLDFTVVVVPKGGTFSGWSNYPLNGPAN